MLGCVGRAFMSGIHVRTKEAYIVAPYVFPQGEDAVSCWLSTTQKRAFTRTRPCWHPDIGLSTFRVVRNKFLFFISYPIPGSFFYNNPDRLRLTEKKCQRYNIMSSKGPADHSVGEHRFLRGIPRIQILLLDLRIGSVSPPAKWR